MNYKDKKFAQQQAAADFTRYTRLMGAKKIQTPIDPDRFAEILWGTSVVYVERGTLPPGVIALADLKNNRIFVECSGYEPRDRFSVAHEVGHMALHKYLADLDEVSPRDEKNHEAQADAYASVLLMPQDLVTVCVKANKGFLSDDELLIQAVARDFFVSYTAAKIRLEGLGLINSHNMQLVFNKQEKLMQSRRDAWATEDFSG